MPYIEKEERDQIHNNGVTDIIKFVKKVKKTRGNVDAIRHLYHIFNAMIVRSLYPYASIHSNGSKRGKNDDRVFSYRIHSTVIGTLSCCRKEWERQTFPSGGFFEEKYQNLSVSDYKQMLTKLKSSNKFQIQSSFANIGGHLNYAITVILTSVFDEQFRYSDCSEHLQEQIMSLLFTLEEDWYQNRVAMYEDIKKEENGEVEGLLSDIGLQETAISFS